MSGHSKWKNILHKKEKTDFQRAKVFTKIGREISVAVRENGPDPNANSKLRDLISKARANNVPTDNIERIIKKAAGGTDGENYEAITYEGYGPSGVALIVETLTDNRNRTAADVRHYMDKYGGNLGQTGSVSWQFAKSGLIVINAEGIDEDGLMLQALESGAEDIALEDGYFEIKTPAELLEQVKNALEKAGYTAEQAEVAMLPANYISLTGEEEAEKMRKLLELLEENDDVQNVWHNWDGE